MRRLRRLAVAVLLSSVGVACSSSGTTGTNGTTPPNVVGTWHITKFEFVSVANSSTREDAAATDNTATAVLTATAFTIADQGATAFSGTYTETATTLVLTGTDSHGNPETISFALSLSGTTLTLTGGSTTHNFGSGEVAAILNLTMTKS